MIWNKNYFAKNTQHLPFVKKAEEKRSTNDSTEIWRFDVSISTWIRPDGRFGRFDMESRNGYCKLDGKICECR